MQEPLFLAEASKKLNRGREKRDMYLVQIDFILLYEYQGFILSPVFSPLTPHGSVHSLGLLFRPDKQDFFVYGNYCLRIVPNVTRLSMRMQAGREGRCDEREF